MLGASVDEELQAPLAAARARVNQNHEKLLGLIRSRAAPDEIEATRTRTYTARAYAHVHRACLSLLLQKY